MCYQTYNDEGLIKNIDAMKVLSRIQRCFFTIIKLPNIDDFGLKKIAYNVVIILVNQYKRNIKSNIDKHIILRVLNVIVTEIEIYRSKYCSEFSLKFSLFDKSQFNSYNDDNAKSAISNFFRKYDRL